MCEKKGADHAAISCMVTMQLICAFVFAYAKCRLSHDMAPLRSFIQAYLIKTPLTITQISLQHGHVLAPKWLFSLLF